MNDKVLIRVSIPIADIAYDFRIPYDLTAGTTARVVTDMIRQIASNPIPLSEDPVLWEYSRGEVLNAQKTIREIGIENGAMLLLV